VKEPPLGISDHNMIEFTLQLEREKLESDVMVLQLNKGNCKDMREELARVDWKGRLAGKTWNNNGKSFGGLFGRHNRNSSQRGGNMRRGGREDETSMADEGSNGQPKSKRKSIQSGED